jgi:hypothetical protein
MPPLRDPRACSSRFEELCAQAEAARTQSRAAVRRARATWAKVSAEWQQVEARWVRADQVRAVWLSQASQRSPRHYSASARMQARLASVPVMEQATSIIMAECGFSADEASDALRRASARAQMRARDVAATIVALTAGTEQPTPTEQ